MLHHVPECNQQLVNRGGKKRKDLEAWSFVCEIVFLWEESNNRQLGSPVSASLEHSHLEDSAELCSTMQLHVVCLSDLIDQAAAATLRQQEMAALEATSGVSLSVLWPLEATGLPAFVSCVA